MFRISRSSNMIVISVVGMCLPKGSWNILIDSVVENDDELNQPNLNSQLCSLRFSMPNLYFSVFP
jgi:hypothetical protein